MPPIRTIQEIILELNSFETRTGGSPTWGAIEGVQALTTVNRKEANAVEFALGSGVLVKGFINGTTGEIKLFPAKLFGYPETNLR